MQFIRSMVQRGERATLEDMDVCQARPLDPQDVAGT